MHTLILVGYWRSKQEPDWPDPAWFIDESWEPSARAQVLEYVQGGQMVAVAAGIGWCRFRCGQRDAGSAMVSDGVYVWPRSLAHYIAEHGVRPPGEFVRHAMRGDASHGDIPQDVMISSAWWQAQRGWRGGASYLTAGLDGRLYATRAGEPPLSDDALLFLRGFPSSSLLSTVELHQSFAATGRVMLDVACDYASYLHYDRQARACGLKLVFEEPME